MQMQYNFSYLGSMGPGGVLVSFPEPHSTTSDVQVCYQRLSSAFDLLLIFLCSLIQTLTLTPPPNNALLANMHGHVR